MTETSLRLGVLREELREPVKLLAEHLRAGLGENLQCVTVVGSSLTDDYRPGASDINTVVSLSRYDTGTLNTVASQAKSMRRYRLSPPLLMTPDYIDRSRDVFGVELLDFQLTHATVLGNDPFEGLEFAKSDVRLQCERELKAMLVRMRQGYVAAAGNRPLVRDVLIATAKGLAPLARAMLWLRDVERPRTMEAALRKTAETFQLNLDAAIAAERWRYEKPRLTDLEVETAFATIVGAVDVMTATVDAMKV
jgi:hypothetical protein